MQLFTFCSCRRNSKSFTSIHWEKNRSMKKFLVFIVILTAAISAAHGQAGLSTLTGTVSDPSGAVIPNASVHLTGVNGVDRTDKTNSSGNYLFTSVPVAEGYTLVVSDPGFATTQITKLNTSVGTTVTQDVRLAVGASTTTVEVTGANVEQVQTETSAVSQLIDRQ